MDDNRHQNAIEAKKLEHQHGMEGKDKDIQYMELQIQLELAKQGVTPRKPLDNAPAGHALDATHTLVPVTPGLVLTTAKKRALSPLAQTTVLPKRQRCLLHLELVVTTTKQLPLWKRWVVSRNQ